MTIETTIMSGAGNIFSVVDNTQYNFSIEDGTHLAPILCSGAMEGLHETEGLMLVSRGESKHSFVMEFFNPDGSHGPMCGNGGRCAVAFAIQHSMVTPDDTGTLSFTNAGVPYSAELIGSDVRVAFGPPIIFTPHVAVGTPDAIVEGSYVDVGSDHFVVDVASLPVAEDQFLIEFWGPLLRNHKHFPRGANINFFSVKENTVFLRTFERGVEAETGACGTGAISTALVCVHNKLVDYPVKVVPTSKKRLLVDADIVDGQITTMYLQGPAQILSTHTVEVEFLEGAP